MRLSNGDQQNAESASRSTRPHVVVYSSLFPNAGQPQAGLFIRERMFRVRSHFDLTVIAPVAWFPFLPLIRLLRPGFRPLGPRYEVQDGVSVYRPRYLSFPGVAKWLDGLSMALCTRALVDRLKSQRGLNLIDAHFAYPDGYAATRLGRWFATPTTITLRGTEVRMAKTPRLRPLARSALEAATRIISVSASLKRVAVDMGIPASKVKVIGNGVDLTKFAPLSVQMSRTELGIDATAKVLVSVGGLTERKGFHRVIECLPELVRRFPDLVYLVVGGASPEGDWTPRLTTQVAALGLDKHVRFLGPLPPEGLKLPLSAADVFVLATSNEGWANVFLEAMACGLPVVTTNVGGNPEVVCRPQLGTIVPFGDRSALAGAIMKALERNWDRQGIMDYAQENSWDRRMSALVGELSAAMRSSSHNTAFREASGIAERQPE